jgi:hypothetical protein
MGRFRTTSFVAAGVLFVLTAAACSSSSKPAASSATTATTAPSGPTVAVIPTAKTISQPVTYGFYDGHIDWMLSTDVSSKTLATTNHINYSAALLSAAASKFPSLYIVSGPAAANQPLVFGSEPGEDDYSPVWREITVKWKAGVTPVLLHQDDQINALASQGKLTAVPTDVVLNCPIVKVTTSTTVPTAKTISEPVEYGYYDGHIDAMLSTDSSSKTEASAKHINYAPTLLTHAANKFPSLYIVSGPAAPNQPLVFGSEPGEDDYSPIWQELDVKWKAGVTPVLLHQDDQINALASQGKLTIAATPVVLNCPIVKVMT